MPQPMKPDSERQRRNKVGLNLTLVKTDAAATALALLPPSDHRWLAATKQAWVDLWQSEMVNAYNQVTDVPALRRLFGLRDQRERYSRAVASCPVVEGSRGQLVSHPLLAEIKTLDPEIRQLEDRFGLNPKARVSLGIKFGQAAASLADLNKGISDDDDSGDGDWAGLDAEGEDVG